MPKISDLIDNILKDSNIIDYNGRILMKLHKIWVEIMDKKYASECKVNSIKTQKNLTILYVKTGNPAVMQFIEMNSEMIIEKISHHFGYRVIDRIKSIKDNSNIY